MNEEKLKLKAEKKLAKDRVRSLFYKNNRVIKDLTVADVYSKDIANLNFVEDAFNKMFPSYHERRWNQQVKKLAKCKGSIGVYAFKYQMEHLRDSNCQLPTTLFCRKEIVKMYEEVLG